MTTFYAYESHHSISRAPLHMLKAKTEVSAKREARRLLGGGYVGHRIYLQRGLENPVTVARCTIGSPGWEPY